jgi:hypothetical protein
MYVAAVFKREGQSLHLQRPEQHLSVYKLSFKPGGKRGMLQERSSWFARRLIPYFRDNEKSSHPAERTTTIRNNPEPGR